MRYRTLILLLGVVLGSAQRVGGENPPRLADALALQEVLEQVIAEAERSVACILISRSDLYQRKYGQGISPEAPGKLGRFNNDSRIQELRRLENNVGLNQEQKQELQEILSLSLHHLDHLPESYGSGVILSESGLILTCAHVVRNATRVFVRLPGQRGSYADIHAADPRSDLAVLKLLDSVPNLKPIKRGDGGKARKGQFVVLLANPFAAGFRDGSPSASWGIISNLRRRAPGGQTSEYDRSRRLTLHQLGTLIQTDMRLNLGSSGGALLNLQGDMIGLTSATAALTGVDTPGGFAVPLDDNLKRILAVLERGEEVEYGFLGVKIDSGTGPGKPVQIQGTADGSPAQKIGLQAGDYIVSIDGVPIRDSDDLLLNIGIHLAGSSLRLEAAHAPIGPRRSLEAKLAKYYVPGPIIASRRPAAAGGLRVDYTSILSQRLLLPRYIPAGVVIREVVPNSPADKVQLQPDKIITRVNDKVVTTPSEFYAAMDHARGPIELRIQDAEGREERITLENR